MADEEILVFEYQEAFAYFDSDRDGKINTTEFAQVLRVSQCPSPVHVCADIHTCVMIKPSLTCNLASMRRRLLGTLRRMASYWL